MSAAVPTLPDDVRSACHAHDGLAHLGRGVVFVALYLVGAVGAVQTAPHVPTLWLLLPFWLLAAASLHGLSLFTHEAVHGTLHPNRWVNGVLGALCALPVLQNFSAYRVLHLRHHAELGNDGDPDHYPAYTRSPRLVSLMNWLRLLVGYPAYITMIPILAFKHGSAGDRLGVLMEVVATALVAGVCFWWLPTPWIFYGWMLPMVLINTMVNIRGMSQHTLLVHSNHKVLGTRTILTNPLVRFFMCNENYHLEHHLYPGVPWHHLPRVHAVLRPVLEAMGAPFIPTYRSFVVDFVRTSLRRTT